MFRYLVIIETKDEHGTAFFEEKLISRLTAFDKTSFREKLKSLGRQHPDASSIEVVNLEESEYLRRKQFNNRHED